MSPSLSRVVQLASSISTGGGTARMLQLDGRLPSASQFHAAEKFDAQHATSAAPWATEGDRQARQHGHQPVVQELNDSFDPVVPSLWEHISGGGVGEACGSVAGKALCFNQVCERERQQVSQTQRFTYSHEPSGGDVATVKVGKVALTSPHQSHGPHHPRWVRASP